MKNLALILAAGLCAVAPAQGRGDPPNADRVYEPTGAPVESHLNLPKADLTAADLMTLTRPELETLYKNSEPGRIPSGEANGRATLHPGTVHGEIDERIIAEFWKGKVFTRVDDEHAQLVNRILDGRFVKAEVFYGESLLDGRRSIIIDYHRTSVVAILIRDEIREVAPGVYLGLAYFRGPTGPLPIPPVLFALDFPRL